MAQNSSAAYAAELQITHQCRWTGCIDWGCTLCRQNAKRCFHDLDPSQTLRSMKPGDRSGVTSSQLKSDCKQPFSVVVSDLSAGSGATQSAASGTIVPTHLQLSLLDSPEGQYISELVADADAHELQEIIDSRVLSLQKLLKAELKDSQAPVYERHQLIIPFDISDEHQTGPWKMSEPLRIYSEYALKAIKNKAGSQAKTVSLLIKGLQKDGDGRFSPMPALKPFISSPFTFFTRRRDDKGVIPSRSTKVDELQAMADATVKKLKNLRESAPQKCSFNINILPAQPITTAGALFDFMEPLTELELELISNKVLGRSKNLLATVRETLRERMITMDNDTRTRLWSHPAADLGLLFDARHGILIGPEESMPVAVQLSSGLPVVVPPDALGDLTEQAMKAYAEPQHGASWSIYQSLPSPIMTSVVGPPTPSDGQSAMTSHQPEGDPTESRQNFSTQSVMTQRARPDSPWMDGVLHLPASNVPPESSFVQRAPSIVGGHFGTADAWATSQDWSAGARDPSLVFRNRTSEPFFRNQYSTDPLESARLSLPNTLGGHDYAFHGSADLNSALPPMPSRTITHHPDEDSPGNQSMSSISFPTRRFDTGAPSVTAFDEDIQSRKTVMSPVLAASNEWRGLSSERQHSTGQSKRTRDDDFEEGEASVPGFPWMSAAAQSVLRPPVIFQSTVIHPGLARASDLTSKPEPPALARPCNPFTQSGDFQERDPAWQTYRSRQAQDTSTLVAELPERASVEMVEASPLQDNAVVSGSSHTVSLHGADLPIETPSVRMAKSYDSDLLPAPDLPSMRTAIHQLGSMSVDALFDGNLRPLPSRPSAATAFRTVLGVQVPDLKETLLPAIPSSLVKPEAAFNTSDSADMGLEFNTAPMIPHRMSDIMSLPLLDGQTSLFTTAIARFDDGDKQKSAIGPLGLQQPLHGQRRQLAADIASQHPPMTQSPWAEPDPNELKSGLIGSPVRCQEVPDNGHNHDAAELTLPELPSGFGSQLLNLDGRLSVLLPAAVSEWDVPESPFDHTEPDSHAEVGLDSPLPRPRRLLSVNRSDRPRGQHQAIQQDTGRAIEPPAPQIRGLFQRMSIEG